MRQTAKRLMRRLSLKESDIGLIGDGAFDPEKQLTISMIQTLSRLAIGKEKANSKVARKLLEECDAVIVDEVHHGKSDSYYKTLMKMPAVYRLGLSGTALKQKELDLMRIKAAISSNVCVITNDFLIQEGYSAKPTIYLHTIENMTIDKKTPSRDELLYEETEDERGEPQKELVLDERGRSIVVTPGVYRIGVINNDGFNEQVADIAKKDSKIGNVLIIVNRTEHGENILAKLDKRFKADLIFSELGTEEVMQKLENFRTGKTEILISTPLVDEGLDLPNIKILILAAGGESPSQLLQRVGRGLRKKGGDNRLYVHDFINCCRHLLLSQSIKRFDEYVNEKFEIIQDGVRLEG
jgi:superfamily II DNA or RNA helicase